MICSQRKTPFDVETYVEPPWGRSLPWDKKGIGSLSVHWVKDEDFIFSIRLTVSYLYKRTLS